MPPPRQPHARFEQQAAQRSTLFTPHSVLCSWHSCPNVKSHAPQAVSAVFAVMTPQQFAHVNVGTTPAHPNAMCIAETLAVVAGEPHARELVRQLQNQGEAPLYTLCRLHCNCLA